MGILSNPYTIHVVSGLALTSISMNLVSLRRTAEDEKYRVNAQMSILQSIKHQLQSKEPLSLDESERLKNLAQSSTVKPASDSAAEVMSGTEVSWSSIFKGKAPSGSAEVSKWEKQDLETIKQEFSKQ